MIESDEARLERFRQIYKDGGRLWGGKESKSGVGSSMANTAAIRSWLPRMFKLYDIQSLVDVPCGDLAWMQQVAPRLAEYVGLDIVPELIATNRARWPRIQFDVLDLVKDKLPRGFDAVLTRDCFIHLPTADVERAIANIRESGAKYLIASTYETGQDRELMIAWRRINLTRPRFGLGEPIDIVSEDEHATSGKLLAIWKL